MDTNSITRIHSFSAATGKSSLPGHRYRHTSNYHKNPGLRCLCVSSVFILYDVLSSSPRAYHIRTWCPGRLFHTSTVLQQCSVGVPSEARDLGSRALNKANPPPPANPAIHRELLLSPADVCSLNVSMIKDLDTFMYLV